MGSQHYLLSSYHSPLPPTPSLLAIIGPKIPFEKPQSVQLWSFLNAGGTVLLADDYGTGNTLLEGLNVSARFAGQPLADLYFYSKSPSFPVISQFTADPITRNLTTIIMDHASYLNVSNPVTVKVLAISSPFSFIDESNNGTLSPAEKTQSYPVIATTHIGRGILVLVANSYIFTNEMISQLNNRILFSNILRLGNGTLGFDVVHPEKAPLTNTRIMFRNELDIFVVTLHSAIFQLALTIALAAVFCTALILNRNTAKQRRRLRAPQSSLHTNRA